MLIVAGDYLQAEQSSLGTVLPTQTPRSFSKTTISKPSARVERSLKILKMRGIDDEDIGGL
jgi:hypothetical protein